ncbi:MAG: hypothetical protein R3E96_05190 [Planctomycetota bacterium]
MTTLRLPVMTAIAGLEQTLGRRAIHTRHRVPCSSPGVSQKMVDGALGQALGSRLERGRFARFLEGFAAIGRAEHRRPQVARARRHKIVTRGLARIAHHVVHGVPRGAEAFSTARTCAPCRS